jgi:two-component system, OmpR family, sensor histidine kinase TctE
VTVQRFGRRLRIPRHRSIRSTLLAGMLAGLTALGLIEFCLEYPAQKRSLDDARDRALSRVAAAYLRSLRTRDVDATSIASSVFREEIGTEAIPALRLRISDDDGRWIAGDKALPPRRLTNADAVLQPQLYDAVVGAQRLRVAIVRDLLPANVGTSPAIVQVAEPVSSRSQALRVLACRLVSNVAMRLAAAMAVAWAAVTLALRPLADLGAQMRRQQQLSDLAAIDMSRPCELAPIAQVMTTLIQEQQRSTDQQRKFLADASHQLRTPLAVLRTQAQGLIVEPSLAATTLPQMLATIDRATRMAGQLLSMAKVEQFVRRANWVEVDLDLVARDLALEFAPLIARKRLDFSLQSESLRLKTDAWLLGELVRNLLSNAIHHSRKGQALGIVVRTLRHEAEMIVWDHGGGVDEEIRTRLFEPFSAARGGSGIGLGLSICRQIADSMNATVDLFNRIEGGRIVGADAIVRWPFAVPAEGPSLHQDPPAMPAAADSDRRPGDHGFA